MGGKIFCFLGPCFSPPISTSILKTSNASTTYVGEFDFNSTDQCSKELDAVSGCYEPPTYNQPRIICFTIFVSLK